MDTQHRDLGEDAVIARVGSVIAGAATEGRHGIGHDARQDARRVALEIATGVLRASRPEVAAHSEDVRIVAGAIGRWLGLSEQQLDDVVVAARLHDIGKLALPEALLDMRTPLGPVEWVAIRRHSVVGEQILVPVPELRGPAVLVRHSHERWDGFGYPDGLAGEAIPLGSRIIACADAFAAMRSDRQYRAGSSTRAALAEIRAHAGTQFDPEVVEALEALADGLRIAADRTQPPSRRATRLFALLLIVSVGTAGAAFARTGAFPDAGTSEAAIAPVPASPGASPAGLRPAPPSLASGPLALRPQGASPAATSAGPGRTRDLVSGGHLGLPAAQTATAKQGRHTHGGAIAPPPTEGSGSEHGQSPGGGHGAGHDHGVGNGQGPADVEPPGGQGKAKGVGNGHANGVGNGQINPGNPAAPGANAGGPPAGSKPAKPKPPRGATNGNPGAGHGNAGNSATKKGNAAGAGNGAPQGNSPSSPPGSDAKGAPGDGPPGKGNGHK